MRVLFTGQTGIDKKGHLQALKELCALGGKTIDAVFSVGDIMYEESQKAGRPLKEGKILDLPQADLAVLRRSAFNRISSESSAMENVFVNSHAVFRWDNQLFRAFELSELAEYRPDLIITLVDDVEAVKLRLDRLKEDAQLPADTNYSLKDLLVWREEEILASEIMASVLEDVPHYVLGLGIEPEVSADPLEVAFSLMFQPWKPKAYLSYPISEARRQSDVWDKVTRFRRLARSHLTAFDPLMVDEKRLQGLMADLRERDPQAERLACGVRGHSVSLSLQEIETILPDIDGQIVARDYKLIDQSDMIIAYFPVTAEGNPLIAAGVQSEVVHAAGSTKEVLIVWEAAKDPTPFIGQRMDKRFSTLDELEEYLRGVTRPTGQLEMTIEPG